MNLKNNFDLNFSPSSEWSPSHESIINIGEEGSNTAQLIDLNIDLEKFPDEEVSNQGPKESAIYIDLNQTPLSSEEENNLDEEVSQQSEEDQSEDEQITTKAKMLNNDERRAIYLALLAKSSNGKLKRGTIKNISEMFSVSRRTISRIWKLSKNTVDGVVDVSHRKTKNCGRKRIEINPEEFRNVPLAKRTCLRSLSCAIKVSPATLSRNLRSGKIRRNSNTIKPLLKESNKKERVQFCLSMIDKSSLPHEPKFVDMNNVIHIDEKWFYISKKCERYYLLPEEDDPLRTCKSKNFLTKVMFLTAIARPRFDSNGKETFSGKIGIFPLVTQEPAKRSSVNRPAGTLETKPLLSVGKDTSRSYLIKKVLPAIFEKWPDSDRNFLIRIQQDNARTHISPDDVEFRSAVSRYGLNIELYCQPPNSPDLNVLDLGFFSAIQSLQHKESARTIDELITVVEKSFDEFPSDSSNHIFITLQECMIEIMKVRGTNNYKIPHMNKIFLERNGSLPHQLQCDAKLVEEVIEWLNNSEDV